MKKIISFLSSVPALLGGSMFIGVIVYVLFFMPHAIGNHQIMVNPSMKGEPAVWITGTGKEATQAAQREIAMFAFCAFMVLATMGHSIKEKEWAAICGEILVLVAILLNLISTLQTPYH